jgi:predicted nucleic acid-binding protein
LIVVDASAAFEVLLRTPASASAEKRLFASGQSLHAPHLIDIEVAQVLRRYALTGQLTAERCREVLADMADLPLARYPHDFLFPRIWELRDNRTAHDAAYVALAEALDAPLLTCDRRLGSASGSHAQIEVV